MTMHQGLNGPSN